MFRLRINYLLFYKSKLSLIYISKRSFFFDPQHPFEFCLPYCVLTFAKKDRKEVLERFNRLDYELPKKLILESLTPKFMSWAKYGDREWVFDEKLFFDEGEYLFYKFPSLLKERAYYVYRDLEIAYKHQDISLPELKRFSFERDEMFFYVDRGLSDDIKVYHKIFLDRGKQGPFVLKPEYASLFSFELAMERVSAKKCTLSSLFEHDPFYLNENYEEKTRDDFFNIYYYFKFPEFVDSSWKLPATCDYFYYWSIMSPPLPLFNVSYSWFSSRSLRRIYKYQFRPFPYY